MRLHLIAVPLLAVLPLAACGSDKKESSTPTAAAPAGGSGNTTGTTSAPGETSGATAATAPAGASPDDAAFCALNRQFTTAYDGVTDAASMQAAFESVEKLVPQIVAAAPAAIKADVETAAKAFVDFRKALEAIDFDPQKIPDTIALDPEVQAASDRVDAYASEHCPES